MSQQYPQDPNRPQPQKKRRRWLPWAAGASAFILGIVIGAAGGGSGTTPSASPTTTVTVTAPAQPAAETTTEPPEPSTPAAPAYGTPTKAHFKLTPKILSKQCFGSAGCNLTYRIIISYTGPSLDPDKTYEVLYEVRGGEDGPVSNTLTVSGDTSKVDDQESIGTKSTNSKLTAVVTEVLPEG